MIGLVRSFEESVFLQKHSQVKDISFSKTRKVNVEVLILCGISDLSPGILNWSFNRE